MLRSLADSGGTETASQVIDLLDLNLGRRLGTGVRWRGAVGNTHDRTCRIVAVAVISKLHNDPS